MKENRFEHITKKIKPVVVSHDAAQPEKAKRQARRVGEISTSGMVRIQQIVGDRNAVPPIPAMLPVGKSSFWKGVAEGRYPPGQLLGPRTRCWKTSDILAIVANGADGWKP